MTSLMRIPTCHTLTFYLPFYFLSSQFSIFRLKVSSTSCTHRLTMQPLINFHAFSSFPGEVQKRVWEKFILNANRNRMVLLSEEKHIIPTRFLTSPSQCVNRSSREVFMKLYPVQLSVFRTFRQAKFLNNEEDSDDGLNTDEEEKFCSDSEADNEVTADLHQGFLYINFDRDIFVVTGLSYFENTLLQRAHLPQYKASAYYKTEPLVPTDCKSFKNIMEIVRIHYQRYLEVGRPAPKIQHIARLNKHKYKKGTFSGAKTCRHVFWYIEHYEHLVSKPGHEFLEVWEDETVLYDKKILGSALG
ncbi:hypothetical protein F5Y04DRAFT_252558 [Hypomontagnella monticulosa]|nr:hypothetical protein F5Y04DRAFT_252558 [Hypomontagnella monticulosa]